MTVHRQDLGLEQKIISVTFVETLGNMRWLKMNKEQYDFLKRFYGIMINIAFFVLGALYYAIGGYTSIVIGIGLISSLYLLMETIKLVVRK